MHPDFDIYGDLSTDEPNLAEEYEKFEEQMKDFELHIHSLEAEIIKLNILLEDVKKFRDNIAKNMLGLYRTIKAVIVRKDRFISELRSQLEQKVPVKCPRENSTSSHSKRPRKESEYDKSKYRRSKSSNRYRREALDIRREYRTDKLKTSKSESIHRNMCHNEKKGDEKLLIDKKKSNKRESKDKRSSNKRHKPQESENNNQEATALKPRSQLIKKINEGTENIKYKAETKNSDSRSEKTEDKEIESKDKTNRGIGYTIPKKSGEKNKESEKQKSVSNDEEKNLPDSKRKSLPIEKINASTRNMTDKAETKNSDSRSEKPEDKKNFPSSKEKVNEEIKYSIPKKSENIDKEIKKQNSVPNEEKNIPDSKIKSHELTKETETDSLNSTNQDCTKDEENKDTAANRVEEIIESSQPPLPPKTKKRKRKEKNSNEDAEYTKKYETKKPKPPPTKKTEEDTRESGRVLRSAARRSSCKEKQNYNEDERSCVNLTHEDNIPVLHLSESFGLNCNIENCDPLVTSSPLRVLREDLDMSLDKSTDRTDEKSKCLNSSNGRKRQRIVSFAWID